MIIKDEKVVEPIEEQGAEIPPPYSPPQVRVVGINQDVPSPVRSQTQAPQNNNRRQINSRPRGASSASIAPSSVAGGIPASSSSSYSGSGSVISGTSSSSATHRPANPYPYASIPPPADIQRKSHVRINRQNEPISTRLVINPYLPFPHKSQANSSTEDKEEVNWLTDDDDDYGPQFGPSLPGDPDKRNVCLQSMNANISAEVWVVGQSLESMDPSSDNGSVKKKAGIDIRTKNGFVHLKVHSNTSSPPFALRIACKNGSVRVVLPRMFSGPLTTRTRNGWVTLSTELANNTTTFTEARGTRKAFVGDFVDSGYGRGEWPGYSAEIICENGRIKICYHDEDSDKLPSISTGDKKFFGHVFS